jgi:hypothetical protein
MLKECRKCHEVKPLTEFYVSSTLKDQLSNKCKLCSIAYGKSRNGNKSPREQEVRFVEYLTKKGIYATLGRNAGDHKWADVVAWGCIRIELKTSFAQFHTERHTFHFNKNQRNNMTSHLIVLETRYRGKSRYHFFDSDHPIFFAESGNRKATVVYTANPNRHIEIDNLSSAFAQALNQVELIEQARQAEIQKMLFKGRVIQMPDRDTVPMKQLPMFG